MKKTLLFLTLTLVARTSTAASRLHRLVGHTKPAAIAAQHVAIARASGEVPVIVSKEVEAFMEDLLAPHPWVTLYKNKNHDELRKAILASTNINNDAKGAKDYNANKSLVELVLENDDKPTFEFLITRGLTLFNCCVDAIEDNNTRYLQLLMCAGANVNAIDDYGTTLLMIAARQVNAEIIKLLLSAGADIHNKNNYNESAFIVAAYHGNIDAIKVLLSAGADIHEQNKNGDTALIIAAISNAPDAIKLLLSTGSNIHHKNNHGYTAFLIAAKCMRIDAMKLLLSAGANINDKDISGNTALMAATSNGHTEAIKLLQEYGATPSNPVSRL